MAETENNFGDIYVCFSGKMKFIVGCVNNSKCRFCGEILCDVFRDQV